MNCRNGCVADTARYKKNWRISFDGGFSYFIKYNTAQSERDTVHQTSANTLTPTNYFLVLSTQLTVSLAAVLDLRHCEIKRDLPYSVFWSTIDDLEKKKTIWSQYVRGHYFKCHFIEQCDICCIHLLHFIMKSKISMFIFIQCCLLYYFFICSLILTFLC